MDFKVIDTGIKGNGRDIIYIDGTYYMVSIYPHGIMTSTDLTNWNFTEITEANDGLNNIAYGNGVFVASDDTEVGIFTSADGTNWTQRELKVFSKYANKNINAAFNTVRFVNNNFVIVTGTSYSSGRREGHILVSKDGIKWTDKFESGDTSFMEVAYGNGIYVAVGTQGGIYISKDLVNWSKVQSGVSNKLVGVSFGKGLFIITGESGIILTSEDGTNWIQRESNTNSYLIRSRYGNGLYVAVGYNATILTSIDGITWQEQDEGYDTGGTWYGMVYANNRYVITGNHFTTTGNVPIIYFDVTREMNASENDCLFIYDTNLNLLGIIDEFISLRWRRKYFEAGEFELVVSVDKNNINLLTKKDNIIIRENYTEAAIIETIDINDNGEEVELSVSGRFLSSITSRRIIQKTINFKGESINGMKTLLDNVTPICNNFEIEETQLVSPNISFQCSYKNLYDYLVKLSKFSLIGFRIVPNIENKVFIFENYRGKDRTSNQIENERYAFSDDSHNIEKSNFIYSSKTEYNYALVGGQGEGSDRVLKVVKKGEETGFNLREIFVDARNQSNDGLTDEEYLNQLSDLGIDAMKDETYTFDTTVDTNDYKTKWDLGDIVDLKEENWNVVSQKIISEIEEIIEDGKREVTIVLGTPLPELFGNEL